MSTKDEVQIYIATTSGWARWARSTIAGAVLSFAPIAVGIACDSSAMQWAGFMFGILMLFFYAKTANGKTTFKSTTEARAYLDKIDAGAAQ